jgi:hypothetical protein
MGYIYIYILLLCPWLCVMIRDYGTQIVIFFCFGQTLPSCFCIVGWSCHDIHALQRLTIPPHLCFHTLTCWASLWGQTQSCMLFWKGPKALHYNLVLSYNNNFGLVKWQFSLFETLIFMQLKLSASKHLLSRLPCIKSYV